MLSIHWLTSKMTVTAEVGPGQVWRLEFYLSPTWVTGGPTTQGIFHCLPRYVNRELEWNWYSWYLNWHEMLAPQVATLTLCTTVLVPVSISESQFLIDKYSPRFL